ncbi:MAG: hypothetical protein AAGK32_10060 [Actinomycetota bacterium]
MTAPDVSPLELTFSVACPQDHAFRVWTDRFGTWWPRSHVMSGTDDPDVFLEPELGGRIFERTASGDEFDWGTIVRWEPPIVLGFRWHLMFDPAEATDVEVHFDPGPDDGGPTTTIRIVHGGWDRLGEAGPERRDRNEAGWTGVVAHFRPAAEHP